MSEHIIKTDQLVICHQKNTILKDISLEIKNGEFVYIIGKVGSGKSSFFKTLYAELPLKYGKAEVAGFQLKKIKKSQIPLLRRKCGIVFQDFKLLTDRNVYANLEFVLKATGWKHKKSRQERIASVLEKVEMIDKQYKMPHELSGGEQQRIVLARALLNAPPLILADEPTGNIDPETSYKLIELLKDLADTGKTILIATHQYDLIEKYPGRVLRCENGTIIEDMELSVQPHTLAPNVIESIENVFMAEESIPDVIESELLPEPEAVTTEPEDVVTEPEAIKEPEELPILPDTEKTEAITTPEIIENTQSEDEKTTENDRQSEKTEDTNPFSFELLD